MFGGSAIVLFIYIGSRFGTIFSSVENKAWIQQRTLNFPRAAAPATILLWVTFSWPASKNQGEFTRGREGKHHNWRQCQGADCQAPWEIHYGILRFVPLDPTPCIPHPTACPLLRILCVLHLHPASRIPHPAIHILHPTSLITHPTSCNLHHSSCISHLTSRILHPASRIPHPRFHIPHPTIHIPHPTSRILHPTPLIVHPASLIPHPTSFIPHPASHITHCHVPHPAPCIPHPASCTAPWRPLPGAGLVLCDASPVLRGRWAAQAASRF